MRREVKYPGGSPEDGAAAASAARVEAISRSCGPLPAVCCPLSVPILPSACKACKSLCKLHAEHQGLFCC